MEVLRLRTMAMKSVFEGGKHQHQSVAQVIALKDFFYLRWCYYSYDRISFTEEVLIEIDIPQELRIEKPGKSEEAFEKYKQYSKDKFTKALSEMSPLDQIKRRAHMKYRKKKRVKAVHKKMDNIHHLSKAKLQGKNHNR